MRKRIDEIASGRVTCAGPAVEFSVSQIAIEVLEGEDFQGEVTVRSVNGILIRGTAVSSHPRMECLSGILEGEEAKIQYAFHSEGLRRGDTASGEIFVFCSQGEYRLPFAASVATPYAGSLNDFAELARRRWQEARRMFDSSDFARRFQAGEERERLLHAGFREGADKDRNLEEFLTACRLKEMIRIEADPDELYIPDLEGPARREVALTQSAWGYAGLTVESDADFIKIEKGRIDAEDFLGSRAVISLYVDPERMHAGRNFGRVRIWNMHQELSISVCASRKRPEGGSRFKAGQIRRLRARLLSHYEEYRLRRIVTGKWTALTCQTADELIEADPDNAWYRLIKAQALLANGQRQDAQWILQEFKRKNKDQRSPQWGYYMYISTLMEREELYISRLAGEIEQIYLEHQENILLFFCLLFLRESYEKNGARKLKAIQEKVAAGWDSPLLYAEAYSLYEKEPFLIHSLGRFEVKILNWARKRGALTAELAEQAVSAFPERLPYQRTAFLLLEECHKILGSEKSLSALLGYLIRNQKHGRRYFPLYALGVQEKLRITGLYEAYLLSMDARSVQEVPQIIRMYFKYNSHLGSRQQAILHVNIIAAKESCPKAYEQNFLSMAKFACEQMKQGRMDDNLAVIYRETLAGGIHSAEIANALSKVLFVHRLTCFSPGASRVIVRQRQLADANEVALKDGVAYFPLYSNDYAILIEDACGNRYGDSVPYQLEKLLHPGKYLQSCLRHAPSLLPFLLYYFSNREKMEVFEEKDLPYLKAVMAAPGASGTYRAWLFPKYFRLLSELNLADDMELALRHADFSQMTRQDAKDVLSLAIGQKLYDQAYAAAGAYGFDLLCQKPRAEFLRYRIRQLSFAKDAALVAYCADVFFEGERDADLTRYLCSYYAGPVSCMTEIFQYAKSSGIDAHALAERLLTQMLVTGQLADCANDAARSLEPGSSSKLLTAYLTYVSYRDFVWNDPAPDGFFETLSAWHAHGGEMGETRSYALLRYFAGKKQLFLQEKKQAEQLLRKSLHSGTCFSFYKDLDPELSERYRLSDQFFVEYRAAAGSQVWLTYAFLPDGEPVTEEMTERCGGVFVKEFILFSGDVVSYSVFEEEGGMRAEKESGTLKYVPQQPSDKGSRYERLNEMLSLRDYGDYEALDEKMQEYGHLDDLAGRLFQIIE